MASVQMPIIMLYYNRGPLVTSLKVQRWVPLSHNNIHVNHERFISYRAPVSFSCGSLHLCCKKLLILQYPGIFSIHFFSISLPCKFLLFPNFLLLIAKLITCIECNFQIFTSNFFPVPTQIISNSKGLLLAYLV